MRGRCRQGLPRCRLQLQWQRRRRRAWKWTLHQWTRLAQASAGTPRKRLAMPLYRAQLTLATLEWGHRRPARLLARPPWPRARRQYWQMMRLVQRQVHRLRQRLSCRRCRCPASLSPRTSTRVARARQAGVTARGLTAVRTATQERSQLRSWRCVAGRRRQRMALHRSTRRHRLLRPRLEWKCPPRHARRPPRRRKRRALIPVEVLTPSHARVVRRSQAPRVNSSHVRQ